MDWTLAHDFTISVNFHGGAVCVSYPFDGTANGRPTYSASPDDAVIQYMSKRYASRNSAMSTNPKFTGGITNGAQWYPLYGGMADWKYVYGGNDIELTVELSLNKWPAKNTLHGYWNDNAVSLLEYFENIFTGVWGRVTRNGEPCEGYIIVTSIPQKKMKSNKQGYFFRVLKPGSYDVILECGAFSSPPSSVTVVEGTPVVVNHDF